jgi:hypothetical protein
MYRICSFPVREQPLVHGVGGVAGTRTRIRKTCPAAASVAGIPLGTGAEM